MLNLVSDFQQNRPLVLNPKFIQGLGSVLSDSTLDKVCLYIPHIIKQGYDFVIFYCVGIYCQGNNIAWGGRDYGHDGRGRS